MRQQQALPQSQTLHFDLPKAPESEQMLDIRPAEAADREEIVQLWHQGWHDAHANLVPDDVLPYRSKDHFSLWLEEAEDTFFVAADDIGVVGFVTVKGAEVVKLYVSKRARGTGVAQALLSFAEKRLCEAGIARAMLLCTAGNVRAERFYAREGWDLSHSYEDALWTPETSNERFFVLTHRFEKDLKLLP